ncbi:hypothetical protein VPNG_09196 [Cytospora leucostoma]|uniref:Ecp2 effector protein domain-containing protein n=1 Tax=Cytospora leucostoma TaxID=1230097 RepID=A0A423VUB4_9PEZI|nr:hypothetical protein VPNG_09196 [Cytospora leucostoma]
MVALSLSKVLVLAAALTQVWGAAVDRNILERDLELLEPELIERDAFDTALLPRSGVGEKMTYTSVAASGTYGGGFWYEEVDTSTATTVTDDEVYTAAKTSWNNAIAAAKKAKKPESSIGCALFVPSKGWILDTSLKAVGPQKQSVQTCDIVTDGNHKNRANCAEMNALAILKNKGWSIPATGAKMACYGNYGIAGQAAKWVNPCTKYSGTNPEGKDGCKEVLQKNAEGKKIHMLPAKKD